MYLIPAAVEAVIQQHPLPLLQQQRRFVEEHNSPENYGHRHNQQQSPSGYIHYEPRVQQRPQSPDKVQYAQQNQPRMQRSQLQMRAQAPVHIDDWDERRGPLPP